MLKNIESDFNSNESINEDTIYPELFSYMRNKVP